MASKTAWVTLLVAGVAGVLLFGSVASFAQRDFRGRGSASEVGRFQAVNVSRGEIILLDTSTGELFTAGPKDIKPLSVRGRATNNDTVEPPGLDPKRFDDKSKLELKDDRKFDPPDKKG